MTRERLWKIYSKRNPSFNGDGNVTMSARGLRKMFETTWDTAYFNGEEEPPRSSCRDQSSGSLDALKKMFGMK